MTEFLNGVTFMFGCAVWIALSLIAIVATLLWLTDVWRAACYLGYRTFADKAEKQAIRKRAQQRAEGH